MTDFLQIWLNIPVWKISSNSLAKIILTPFREGEGVIPKFRLFLGPTRSFWREFPFFSLNTVEDVLF